MYPDSCGPANKFQHKQHRTETSRAPTQHTLQHNKSGGLASLCVNRPLQPRYLRRKIRGGGLGATGHTRGRPAKILCNALLGNESPNHRQCDQPHPKRKMRTGRWSKNQNQNSKSTWPWFWPFKIAQDKWRKHNQSGQIECPYDFLLVLTET